MVKKTITIKNHHDKWISAHCISLSKFIQKAIDKAIKKENEEENANNK